jgi:glycosyltransferase involved in cell wall biosynthesis
MNTFTLKGVINLFKKIRNRNFDIIHGNAGIIPNILGKLLGVRLNLESKHGILISDEELYNMSFKLKLHEKIKEYFVDYFIAESENDKQKMIKYFRIKNEKIKVIYNGIDLKKKYLTIATNIYKSNNDEKNIIIGTIGRLTFQKGIDLLIKAFANVADKINNIKLFILGSGENETYLKNVVIENGCENKVIFIKYNEDIYDFYNKLDIFILTSRYEGVPYVILEAMNYGLPIISTRVGGIDNILTNGYSALLVENCNTEEISNSLIRLIEDPLLRNKLSSNALIDVQKYSIEEMSKNVENFYLQKL